MSIALCCCIQRTFRHCSLSPEEDRKDVCVGWLVINYPDVKITGGLATPAQPDILYVIRCVTSSILSLSHVT